MSFKPDGYHQYIEIIVRDGNGSKIEREFCYLNNTKQCQAVIDWLVNKYGFGIAKDKSKITDPNTSMLFEPENKIFNLSE